MLKLKLARMSFNIMIGHLRGGGSSIGVNIIDLNEGKGINNLDCIKE